MGIHPLILARFLVAPGGRTQGQFAGYHGGRGYLQQLVCLALAVTAHQFKALALGAPYTKLVCMGRGIMIPGFVGSNIEGALHPERKGDVNGHWSELPKTVRQQGSSAKEIFSSYFDVEKKVGKDEMKNIPYGAIAFYTLADKLACGLQQLMAGARKFNVAEIAREDLMSGNRATAEVTGIPFMTDAQSESAMDILTK